MSCIEGLFFTLRMLPDDVKYFFQNLLLIHPHIYHKTVLSRHYIVLFVFGYNFDSDKPTGDLQIAVFFSKLIVLKLLNVFDGFVQNILLR